jgi:flagellar assembly protein FliH
MSSSENRIIKDAKMSSCPVVIVMHDFAELESSPIESEDDLAELTDLESDMHQGPPQPDPTKHIVEELIREGQKKAEELMQNANREIAEMKVQAGCEAAREADRLKEQAAEAGRQQGRQQGQASGLSQGLEEAKQQMADQLKQTSERCNAMLTTAEQEARQILLEAEPKIIELVLAISRKIITDEVETRPTVVLNLVRSALERVRDQHQIIIHVSPDDYEFIIQSRRELQAVVGAEQTLTVTADAVLGKGGCLIETSFGTVEAGIDTQFESIRRVLQGMLP